MAILEIVKYPEESLLQKSVTIEKIDDKIKTLVKDMGETMFDAPGVGLAAPQVGQNIRLIIYNPFAGESDAEENGKEEKSSQEFKALINPEIISSSGNILFETEACLSVPDYSANVKRFEKVTVKGLNLDGTEFEFEANGIQAIIMQHEIDHLNGTLFIDRISRLKSTMYKKKIKKAKKQKR